VVLTVATPIGLCFKRARLENQNEIVLVTLALVILASYALPCED